jgi:3-hydroxyisobutyrate dehydrogenase-like beta-hydroxyacid dehydrogenase
MTKEAIGIIGLGIIGSRVAANVAAAGYEVHTWSRTSRSDASFRASPRAVAEAAAVVQIFVRDDAALLAAMADMAPALTVGHLVMNHATVSHQATQAAAEIAAKSGAGFLDAPFTGSKMAAQNAKLVYYVGGDPALLERARPVLEVSGTKILSLGKIGDAMVLKIATNAVSAVTVKVLAEALAMVRSQGIDGQLLLAALEGNANYSTLVGMKLPTMLSGDYQPHFSLRNMLKDADFGRAIGAAAGESYPALDAAASAMRAALEAGQGDMDFSVIGSLSCRGE